MPMPTSTGAGVARAGRRAAAAALDELVAALVAVTAEMCEWTTLLATLSALDNSLFRLEYFDSSEAVIEPSAPVVVVVDVGVPLVMEFRAEEAEENSDPISVLVDSTDSTDEITDDASERSDERSRRGRGGPCASAWPRVRKGEERMVVRKSRRKDEKRIVVGGIFSHPGAVPLASSGFFSGSSL